MKIRYLFLAIILLLGFPVPQAEGISSRHPIVPDPRETIHAELSVSPRKWGEKIKYFTDGKYHHFFVTNDNGHQLRFISTRSGKLKAIGDARGRLKTLYRYDRQQRLEEKVQFKKGQFFSITRYSYDRFSRPVIIKTLFSSKSRRKPERQLFIYDRLNRVKMSQKQSGPPVYYQYDEKGQVVRIDHEGSDSIYYVYNDMGKLIREQRGGNVIQYDQSEEGKRAS